MISKQRTIQLGILCLAVFLGCGSSALASTPGSQTGEPSAAFGRSDWSYQDVQDSGAVYEGGYAAFDEPTTQTYAGSPHGGYDTGTDDCSVCHAVHRAEGAYQLLRADSQDDACDYCHVGGSAHSSMVVYDLNSAGTYTSNGHGIGAGSAIPDSTTLQWAQTVTLSASGPDGEPVEETIYVRSYDAAKNEMYRLSRYVGGSGGSLGAGYAKVGPLALGCMNCHHPHNAAEEIWRPTAAAGEGAGVTGAQGDGYKLLRLYPSGSTTGTPGPDGRYEETQAVKVPETTLTAGFNYSANRSMAGTFTEYGKTRTLPVWVAQNIGPERDREHGPDRDADSVSAAALSVWCADCHNLSIGGSQELEHVELGFRTHSEATHPVPYGGAYSGPGQCYGCHRGDLPPQMGAVDPVSGRKAESSPSGTHADGCTKCHFGTADYFALRASDTAYWPSDFPHSGRDDGFRLLGSYSVDATDRTTIVTATITPWNLDAVCLRCHPGIGIEH